MAYLQLTVQEDEAAVIDAILTELRRARAKFPKDVNNMSDAALVLSEEAGEVSEAVLKYYYEGGTASHIREELIQVGAMAIRQTLFLDRLALTEYLNAPKPALFSNGDKDIIPLENIDPNTY